MVDDNYIQLYTAIIYNNITGRTYEQKYEDFYQLVELSNMLGEDYEIVQIF